MPEPFGQQSSQACGNDRQTRASNLQPSSRSVTG